MQLPILFCVMYAFCCLPIMEKTAGFMRCVIHALASLYKIDSQTYRAVVHWEYGVLLTFAQFDNCFAKGGAK